MAPTKVQTTIASNNRASKMLNSLSSRRAISTRGQKQTIPTDGSNSQVGKRKADGSPRNDKVKRSALGNVTNAVLNANDESKKPPLSRSKSGSNEAISKESIALATKKVLATNNKSKSSENVLQSLFVAPNGVAHRPTKVVTRSSARATTASSVQQTVKSIANTLAEKAQKENISTTANKGKKKTETITSNNNNANTNTFNRNATASTVSAVAKDKLDVPKPNGRRISNEFDLPESEDSHYMSALEDLTATSLRLSDARKSTCTSASPPTETLNTISEQTIECEETLRNVKITSDPVTVPEGVIDFDRENWDDPLQASHYAMDIFNYLKERENEFKIDTYLDRQPHLTPWMRTLLVDWMVEVQETFELNHETLYLAVKIVDLYLSKVTIQKEKLQLLGAAALFMACKYDERTPPLIDDFLYICDGAYKQHELIRMEMDAFRTIGYDLGIPLSYRFLRRYARCAKVTMPELTLARFILEFSLMNYDLVTYSDSKIASACLFMALRMSNKTGWNKTLQYFSGYKLTDFQSIIPLLNAPLHHKQREANKTIRNKYAHKVFFEVSKVQLMSDEKLFAQSDLIETL